MLRLISLAVALALMGSVGAATAMAATFEYSQSPLEGTQGMYVIEDLPVSGGMRLSNFMITSGSLPAGMTLNPLDGAIGGVPEEAGEFSVSIMASSSSGVGGGMGYANGELWITISPR